jgi:PAS domain-containing protein
VVHSDSVSNNSAQHGDRYRILFEHSSDAHFIFDETGITDCNDATVQLLKATDKAHVLSLHPAVSIGFGTAASGLSDTRYRIQYKQPGWI